LSNSLHSLIYDRRYHLRSFGKAHSVDPRAEVTV
jgi:hypothetical protein